MAILGRHLPAALLDHVGYQATERPAAATQLAAILQVGLRRLTSEIMSKLAKWSLRVGSAFLIAAISVAGTLIYIAAKPTPQVALTANLDGAWDTASAEFDRRVKSHFLLGSTETEMGNELHKQGFSRDDWTSSVDSEHEATRREDNWVCRQAAHIYWRSDRDGRITAIRGQYGEEGCL